MSQQQQQEHRLGELLIEMGFLQQKELEDAVAMANQTRLPLGSVLVMSGHLSDKELRACVLGQSLLKDNVIVKEDMFQVMRIVRERGVSFEEGMQMLEGKVEKVDKETNKLGELLFAAERITAEQLQTALDTVESSGLPLGRVLVLTGAVNEPVLKVGLEVQVGVRDGSISREEAIQRLRTVSSGSSVTRQSIEMTAPTLDKILRLGEFFEKAGIISDTDMLNALEVALTQQRRVGEVLVQFNLVTEKMVEAALELQHLTRGRQIRPDQAVSALQNMHFNGMTLHQALGVPEPEAMFVRPEALYQPGPAAQAPMAVPAVQPAPAPTVPPPPPPPTPVRASEDPNAVLLSGWGEESPAEEIRDGWGDQAAPAPQTGWGNDAQAAPTTAPQPQVEAAQAAAPPTFAQPQQAPAAAPMQQFVTASGEYGAVAMGAATQPQGLVPPPPPGYAPLPAQPITPQAYDQSQGNAPAMPPAQPAPAPAVMQGYEAPAGYTPLPAQPAASVPAAAVPQAQPAPASPAPEAAPSSPAPEAAPPSPAPEAAPPSATPDAAPASPQPEPAPASPPAPVAAMAPTAPMAPASPPPAPPQSRSAVDGVIAEIAFEAAQFAQAQESAAASAGGLGFEAVGLAQLLKVTGIVTQDEMDRAIKDVIRDSVLLHDILKSSGVGDPMTLRAAYDAHIMVIGGQLTFEHAMIALDYCKRGKLSLYESFKQLGWLQE